MAFFKKNLRLTAQSSLLDIQDISVVNRSQVNIFSRSILNVSRLLLVVMLAGLFKVTAAVAATAGSLSDSNIKYFGRWDFSNPSEHISYWGGAYFEVAFSGATVKIKLGNRSNFYVKIDNSPWKTYTNITGTVNLTPIPLAGGSHTLRVGQGKDYDYVFNFQGLVLDPDAVTRPPPLTKDLIEFIGDSITTGYTDSQANISDYAWVCSEDLDCEHTQIAYPGINLVSGYAGTGMDVQYFKSRSFKYSAAPEWNFISYTPKVIIINLGQNDGGANKVPDSVFQNSYIKFLTDIRTKYPNVEIFAMRVFLGFKAAQIQAAVNARIVLGDTKVHYIDTTGWLVEKSSDYNDGVHPSVSGHMKVAKQLQPILAPYLGGDVVGKLTVGYQGWFSSVDDGSPVNKWEHNNLEMWPDVREYAKTYPTSLAMSNGGSARMFSSYDDQTVQTHFRWMAENGIDCAALQRFANELHPGSKIKAQRDGMALKVKAAAESLSRKFYIMYDTSGWGLRGLKEDWTNTVINTLHLTESPAYAKQNDKPVVCIYGMGYVGWPASADAALELINWFKDQGCYVIGSIPGSWLSGAGDSKPDFINVYSAFNMISAWAVGRRMNDEYASWIEADQAFCQSHNIEFQPCIYPGTSFHNSNGSKKNLIPRHHGDLLWSQFATLKSLHIPTAYVAMFDELNEATSIFKCAEDASMMPTNKWLLPLDADGVHVSSDFYLRLVNDGGQMIKGFAPYQANCPTPFHLVTKNSAPQVVREANQERAFMP